MIYIRGVQFIGEKGYFSRSPRTGIEFRSIFEKMIQFLRSQWIFLLNTKYMTLENMTAKLIEKYWIFFIKSV